MGIKFWGLLVASVLVAYYIYSPIPENAEDRWKLMLLGVVFRTTGHVATIAEKLGFVHHMDIMSKFIDVEYVPPVSDEKVNVTETKFNDVPVRLYIPKGQPDSLKRAVIYFHGGGWCLGNPGMKGYDNLSRRTSERLNAVVVSVDYRLAPKYHFPVQFEDSYAVAKFFLQPSVLEQYNVEPTRVCVSGDSAGGNLAAAVAQQLLQDPEVKVKLKIQVLIYPALQTLDLNLPSYKENENMILLPKSLMIRFWSEYFTTDLSLKEAMEINEHVPEESSDLFNFVNWSHFLPEKFKRGHIYTRPTHGSSKVGQKYPGFLDPRAAPLLVDDVKLRGLPLTYVITCQYDVLRDDGIMYASRLKGVGVPVIHEHAYTIHGVVLFTDGPLSLTAGQRIAKNYIEWLNENL